jgi:hypothetical protein
LFSQQHSQLPLQARFVCFALRLVTCQETDAAMAEFLNFCQDGVKAVMCSGILLKNNDDSA